MLKFNQVDISIEGNSLFSIQEIHLENGLYAIVGRNGTGKTTFLNAILSQEEMNSGAILLNDQPVSDFNRTELAKNVAVVFTKPNIFGNHLVSEVLALGRLPYQNLFSLGTKEDEKIIDSVLELLEISDLKNRIFNSLSDGEKQMCMIGRALVQETNVLILDEPSAFLDPVNRFKLHEVLVKIAKESNKLILFSTHHIDELHSYCDGVLLISNQQMNLITDKNNFKDSIYKAFKLPTSV